MSKENNTKLSTTTNNNSEYQNNSKKHRKLIRTTNNNNSTSNNNNHCDSLLNNQTPSSPSSSSAQPIPTSISISQLSALPAQQNLVSPTQSIVQTVVGTNSDDENNSSSRSSVNKSGSINLNHYPSFSIRCSSIDQQQEDAVVIEILASRKHTTTPTLSSSPSPKQSQPPPFPPPILQASSIVTPSPSSLIQTSLVLTNQMDQYKSNKSTTDKATSPIIPNSPSLSSASTSFLQDSIDLSNLIKLQQQQQPTSPTNQSPQQKQQQPQQHHHHYHQTTKIINFLNPDSLQSHSTPSSLNSSKVNLHEPITTTTTTATTTLNTNNSSSSNINNNNVRNISNQMLSTSLSSSTINHIPQQQNCSGSGINKSATLKQQQTATTTAASLGACGAPLNNNKANKKSITNPFFCDKFKRDEFLKATMRICLVVSPPSSKLQSKSKSLTHLDQLDQNIEIQNDQTLIDDTQPHPPTSLVEIKHFDVQHNNLNNINCKKSTHKMCWLATTISTTTTITSNLITPTTLPSPIFPTSSLSPSSSTYMSQPAVATTPTKTNPTVATTTIITLPQNSNNTTTNNVASNVSSSSPLLSNTITTTTTTSPATITATSNSSASSYIKKKSSSFLHRNYTSSSTKKPMLSRSEVSSSEYFTVLFNLENDHHDDRKELIIPSTKGVTLANALASALNMRNLSFSQIQISDNNFQISSELGSYTGVVDEHTDIGMLSGKMLIVTEKESLLKRSHSMLKKAASIGHSKTQKLFSSASTEETLADTDQLLKLSSQSLKHCQQPTPQTSKRWSFLGVKSPQQNQLCELLNHYAKTSVPNSKIPQLSVSPEYAEAVSYLEIVLNSTWINFVDRTGMSDQEMKIQSAIWELVSTEADYIRALQTVTNLFLACLEGIQSENLLTDIDQNKLFSNIREICDVNIKFWSVYLYPMVKQSELNHTQLVIDYFQDGFLSFAKLFEPYTKYCAEQSTCQNTCKELNSSNLLFTAYLAWCESRSECKRLRLADILVRPMQRLTKYSLLLVAIRKHLSSDETGCEIMDSMIHSVEDFVCSVNSHLTTRQENERLKGIMARIEVYDVVDSINEHLDKMVKQYNQMFDLCEPMKGCSVAQSRHLFMEGDLKFKDHVSKVDVHCFLLTDILLICKITKRGQGALKIIRQPYMTDKLVIQLKDNVIYCVYLNDFNTALTAFSLQTSEGKVIKNWHDSITKAKHIYTRIKQGSHWDEYNFRSYGGISGGGSISGGLSSGIEGVSNSNLRKSPHSSSIGSKVPSSNNSVSGSVELNESVSKNISIDYEKANSLSSDEGVGTGFYCSNDITIQNQQANKQRSPQNSFRKIKIQSANSLIVQPSSNLGQSLPNLTLNSNQNNINNQLLVPGVNGGVVSVTKSQQSSSNHLLSPSHRGISYPPPSPPRATLQRTRAISSVKNPPLMKTKNVTSQSSFNWTQSQTDNTNIVNLSRNQTSDPNIHNNHHHHQLQQQQSSPTTISSSSPTSSSSNQTPQQPQQMPPQPQLPFIRQESDV